MGEGNGYFFIMPVIQPSGYPGPPLYQFNRHVQTIAPAFQKISVGYIRERIQTPDDDFLDLDWVRKGNKKLVIFSHGLEGNASRPYITGPVKYFSENGWDALAWNCRSCGGEMNRQFRLYHHGEIEDISAVVRHALQTFDYEEIALIGFSMGGNISLKYAAVGADNKTLPEQVRSVIAFSSPLDLKSSIRKLAAPDNLLYRRIFIRQLKAKALKKAAAFPGRLDEKKLLSLTTWEDQIRFFAEDFHGFSDQEDFFKQGSAGNFLQALRIPTLIVQALNDPMLTPECFPTALAEKNDLIYLETPKNGGHCGFSDRRNPGIAWTAKRAFEFISKKEAY